MFQEIQNTVWSYSDPTLVSGTNELNTSIDGSAIRLDFAEADETATVTFSTVDLSDWEELLMWVLAGDQLAITDLFRITIGTTDYDFSREDLKNRGKWNQLIFDCTSMGNISSITFTSLVANLVLIVDYIGYRKVTYNMDIDIITALKNHITLDYDTTTTLSTAVTAGDEQITLASKAYVTETSFLELEDSIGNIETVQLMDLDGNLSAPVTGTYTVGNEVRVICPVRAEDYDNLEPDPICGIKIYDKKTGNDPDMFLMKNGIKYKEYLGSLGIVIYLDCSNKKKLLQLCREFDNKYGQEFQFLLDGDKVDIYLDTSQFAENMIGNNPRMAYYYRIEPQPYTQVNFGYVDTLNITTQSEEVEGNVI